MKNVLKGLAEAIEDGSATLHHGSTKDCPTPTASGACPGHPITAIGEIDRQRALIADLAAALRAVLQAANESHAPRERGEQGRMRLLQLDSDAAALLARVSPQTKEHTS